jgi:hypothetical protein
MYSVTGVFAQVAVSPPFLLVRFFPFSKPAFRSNQLWAQLFWFEANPRLDVMNLRFLKEDVDHAGALGARC